MIKVVITAVLISFGISAVACPVLIPFLKKIKFGQQVREDGPQAHLKKQGTPTMGGIAFLFSVILTSLFFMKSYPQIIPILFMTVGFGFVGFLDDYIKVVRKHSEGLNPKQKMAAQFVITAIFCFYMMKYSGGGTVIHIPFLHTDWDMGWLYIPMVFLVVLGTDNGVNFTDGLDGLCTSVTIIVATFFTVVAMTTVSGIVPITGAVVGALLGFLLFNVYPAQVFMGDTGSLALGGFVASTALVLQNPLIILLVGFIYLIEVISVMIQVVYFKKTHGKRFFRMAPIHHHFELGGWSETRVVAVFTTVTALLCLIALLS
ncbi:phospho-N-acetylmuramoyl-pentapeptide-transferase [Hominifimenecus microfluidus]|uniref:phospho-N-acetylmuramoyl-pentapeptide- transferase n=1 Tax=Hominifimenecus microfluidus TaxID=2885348 RepID=UPI0032BFA13B